MTSPELPAKPKRIWHWALGAGWIAAILAVLGSIGAYVHAPIPDGTAAGGRELITYIVSICAASAIFASVIVWAIFFSAVFVRRASIIKGLTVLAIMTPTSFAIATPLSFMTMLGHASIRSEQIESWNRETSQRVRVLHQATEQRVAEAGELTLRLQREGDIDSALERSRRVLALYQDYESELEQTLTDARQKVATLDLTETERQGLLDQSERSVFADLRADAADNVAAARLRAEMITLLHSEQAEWTIQDGHIAFYDPALMARIRAMGADYDVIIARINARASTPSGSAPQPQQ